MNNREAMEQIERAVVEAEMQGVKSIDSQRLLAFLSDLKTAPDDDTKRKEYLAQVELETYRAKNQRWLQSHSHVETMNLELFRTVIAHGQAALKSVILINGGAAVALLGFLGHLLSEVPHSSIIKPLAFAEGIFIFGVLAGAIASGGTYVSQYFYTMSEEGSKKGRLGMRMAFSMHILTVLLVVTGYALFGYGGYQAVQAFLQSQH